MQIRNILRTTDDVIFPQFWVKIWLKVACKNLFRKASGHKLCPRFRVETNSQISCKPQQNQDPDLRTFSSARVSKPWSIRFSPKTCNCSCQARGAQSACSLKTPWAGSHRAAWSWLTSGCGQASVPGFSASSYLLVLVEILHHHWHVSSH